MASARTTTVRTADDGRLASERSAWRMSCSIVATAPLTPGQVSEGHRPIVPIARSRQAPQIAPAARDAHTAVRGLGPDERPAVAERRRELAADAALQRHGEIDIDAAVDGAGFEARGVVLRNAQPNPTVRGLEVEARALPRVARELGVDAAIRRAAAHVAGDTVEADSAVLRPERKVAADVGNGDRAVLRFEREIDLARRQDLVADAPARAAALLGTFGPQSAVGANVHRARDALRLGLVGSPRVHGCAHLHVAAVLAHDADAAVLPGIHRQHAAGGYRELANLADVPAGPVTPTPPVVLVALRSFLCIDRRRSEQHRQHQHPAS